jgi:lysophospholipase L1-like esterase
MFRNAWLARTAITLAISGVIAGCSDTKDLVRPYQPIDPMFTSYVALGNSITAGFQAGGISATTQSQSYAVALASGMKTPFSIPSLRDPGCPPPIDNIITGHRVGDGTAGTCALRSAPQGQAVINNVAVPGAFASDPTDPLAAGANNALSTFILGGKTQVQRALDANPTFVSVWIGNNDVLPAALSGILAPVPEVSPGLTDVQAFSDSYNAMLDALTAKGTIKGGVLIGVVNAAAAPIFIPGAAILNPQVKGAAEAYVGRPLTVDGSCTPTTQSLIDFRLLSEIRAGTQPDTIACSPIANHPRLLGNVFVLDAGELATLTQVVNGYNAAIEARANELGWAYFDPNPALAQLRASGDIPLVPNLGEPTNAFGTYISLDGVHPAGAGQPLLADLIAAAINDTYGTSLPTSASQAQ